MAFRNRRPLTKGTAMTCALLDAAALRLDLGAAAGRQSLVRGPIAMSLRATATILRFWNTSWVGRYLGLAWLWRTFRRGMQPPR
ncbi:MAG: hypothetical protein R2848_04490 [Thermomicrobiales bacterium]